MRDSMQAVAIRCLLRQELNCQIIEAHSHSADSPGSGEVVTDADNVLPRLQARPFEARHTKQAVKFWGRIFHGNLWSVFGCKAKVRSSQIGNTQSWLLCCTQPSAFDNSDVTESRQ